MRINDVIEAKHLSKYRIAKNSGIPYMTLNDICNGKTNLANCSARTVYRLARELDVPMEKLLEPYIVTRADFELFKSNVCHRLKRMGDKAFLKEVLKQEEIFQYYEKDWYPECLYLLAMVDYLSRLHNIPLDSRYDPLREIKLPVLVFPSSVLADTAIRKNESIKEKAIANAIPEFLKFNIVEGDIRNVF